MDGSTVLGRAARAAVALALAALAVLVTEQLSAGTGQRSPGALAAVVVAVAALGAFLALQYPVPGTVVAAAALGTYVARSYPNGPVLAVGLVVLFLLGGRTDRRTTVAGLVLVEAAMVIGWLAAGRGGILALLYPGWIAGAAAVGAAVRNRRDYLHEAAARTESLERERAEEALRLLAEDRLRIARDLHDGVAHAMATITVQAAAAAHVLDEQPAAAREALSAIARAGASVLDELNAMLSVLREPDEPVALAPAPGLTDLDPLVDGVRDTGRDCRLTTSGPLDAVAAPVGTAAYRIVQEALTNVLKHSSAARVDIELVVDPAGSVRLAVVDDGEPAPAGTGPAGNGVRGMRERALATGGTLAAGPAGRGYAVRAEWRAGR